MTSIDPTALDRVRAILDSQVASGRTPAVVTGVSTVDEVVCLHAAGEQRPGHSLSADAVFPFMSLTKVFTAGLLVRLMEDGVVGAGDRVGDHLEEVRHPDFATMLVHHLLSHTSGLSDETIDVVRQARLEDGSLRLDPADDMWRNWMLAGMDHRPVRPPGSAVEYCNYAYSVLGMLVERVTGRGLDELLRDEIFEPAGMHSTAMILDASMRERLVHRPDGHTLSPTDLFDATDESAFAAVDGAFGVFGTVPDLVRYGRLLLNGGTLDGVRVFSPAGVDAMLSPRTGGVPAALAPWGRTDSTWSYGWSVYGGQGLSFPYFMMFPSPGCAGMYGYGGAFMQINPATGTALASLEVLRDTDEGRLPLSTEFHRVAGVVTAATTPG